jgi:quinol monooxygenase YgiN
MIISTITIKASRAGKDEILDILLSVKEPTEAKPGCVSCHIYQSAADGSQITYREEWIDKKNLFHHIRSPLYRSVLAAMDMSLKQPSIHFYTVSKVEEMELIQSAMSCLVDNTARLPVFESRTGGVF